MRQYADSSFLVSCYLRDANTAQAILLVASTSPKIIFTPLHKLEIRNALQLQVFRRALSPSEAKRIWRVLMQDIRRGRLIERDVKWATVFRSASRLSPYTGDWNQKSRHTPRRSRQTSSSEGVPVI
jgi:hypothetical protein